MNEYSKRLLWQKKFKSLYRIIKWLSTLEVKNFSEKLMLRPLFASSKVRKIADLYTLKASDLTRFEGVQEKSSTKALNNLFSVKSVRLERFLAGFDIEDMGECLIKRVVDAGFDSLDKKYHSSVTELSNVEGFGEISAATLLEGVKKHYPDMMEVLNTNKISIKGGEKM